MRLDYLDGIEEEEMQNDNIDYVEPDSVDLALTLHQSMMMRRWETFSKKLAVQ